MKYRPEIDGLRAIAVLPVILFHAGFGAFSGGFVGVDVFFVISGFLITSIIVKDVEAGTFSFWDFYERRARRILPALFFVMLCCIPFAWLWMQPMEMKAFSASVVSVCLFVSNFLFWQQSGYFEGAAELKPLLHTWSLAVEEQYYIIFPIAVFLMWRLGRRNVIWSIALIAVLSLAFSEYASRYHPDANFYLLPTRAWELMAGALCSFVVIKANALRDNVLSVAGFAAIVVSVFASDETIPFPSLYALPPVLGTCAILLCARKGTLVGSLLSLKPIVGIGLISYSAYLWHQPLFAFARIRSLTEPTWQLMLVLGVASIVLAYFSWMFVEVPARKRGVWPLSNRRNVFAVFGLVAVVFITSGMTGHITKGYPTRWPPEVASLLARVAVNHGLSKDCEGEFSLAPTCRTSDKPKVLLWGDSYAMHLADGIKSSNLSNSLIQITKSVCGPIMGIAPTTAKYPISWAEQCINFNDQVFEFTKSSKSIKFAVLSSPFGQFVNSGSRVLTRKGDVVAGKDVALTAFTNTLDALKQLGITPIVVAPPPRPGFDAGNCLIRAKYYGLDLDNCTFSLMSAKKRQGDVRDFLKRIAASYCVVWLDSAICKDDKCFASRNDTFIYRDTGHLSHEGSAYVGQQMNFCGLLSNTTTKRGN